MSGARELKIKSGAVRRLGADVQYYIKDKEDHEQKVSAMVEEGAPRNEVKRARDFVSESDAALQDVRMRFQTAYADLEEVVQTVNAEARGDELVVARATALLMLQTTAHLAPASLRLFEDEELPPRRTVVVYGSSTCKQDDALWALARELGSALARMGCTVINGGYGGSMAASSQGAVAEGGLVEGVVCPSAFPMRGSHGNKHLTREISVGSLGERVATLAEAAECCVVLPGSLGTLNELVYTWNRNNVLPSPTRVILAFREPWEKLITACADALGLPPAVTEAVRFVDSVEDVTAALRAMA